MRHPFVTAALLAVTNNGVLRPENVDKVDHYIYAVLECSYGGSALAAQN